MTRFAGTVIVTRIGGRALVEWDRPPLNVFTARMLRDLSRALRSVDVLTASVVVLRGRGKGWSAGLDVAEHLNPTLPEMLNSFRDALRALWEVPVPTVAQVHGACLGGGLEFLSVCDMAVAETEARFGQPEILLGVFAPLGAAHYPATYGGKPSSELLYLGEPMSATRAHDIGLVNRLCPADALEDEVSKLADTLASYRREALVALKRALRASGHSPWEALETAETIYLHELMAKPDAEEGLRAFIEKRPAQWGQPTPRAASPSRGGAP